MYVHVDWMVSRAIRIHVHFDWMVSRAIRMYMC